MRVLLVYHNPSRVTLPAPPVGLAYVATATRAAGHEVRFLDLSRRARPAQALARALGRQRPAVVGLSVRNIDTAVRQCSDDYLAPQRELIAVARRAGVTVVVGGPAVALLGAHALDRLGADYAIVGEGEATFPALLAALERGTAPADIPGLCWRDGEGRSRLAPAKRLVFFGGSGLERWIDWRPYERAGHTWPIQTRRGCALGCVYCVYPAIEGQRIRRREPAEVVEEIARVHARWRPRTFEIVDSTFNVPVRHALELCEELRRHGPPVRLTTMGFNPRGATDELFDLLRPAGFRSLMISAESAADRMLTGLGKGFGRDDVVRTAALARASGLACAWFFLLGGPGETPETVEETLRFVEEELPAPRHLAILFTGIRLLPGSPLHARQVAAGALAADLDPAEPTYFLSPEVEEGWILDRINATIARRSNVVHAAEGTTSRWQRLVERGYHALGLAPPYWRFVPRYLSLPPVRTLRRRFPTVGHRAS